MHIWIALTDRLLTAPSRLSAVADLASSTPALPPLLPPTFDLMMPDNRPATPVGDFFTGTSGFFRTGGTPFGDTFSSRLSMLLRKSDPAAAFGSNDLRTGFSIFPAPAAAVAAAVAAADGGCKPPAISKACFSSDLRCEATLPAGMMVAADSLSESRDPNVVRAALTLLVL